MAPAPPRLRILSGEHSLFIIPNDPPERWPLATTLINSSAIYARSLSDTAEMKTELRRVCIVGGNAVSAFLSWRLQATNACDVTLVWKANYQQVAQYGISFR
jgi:Ketopantoate reductase PanE/ApbA